MNSEKEKTMVGASTSTGENSRKAIDEKYCVVQFIHPNKCRDEIFSAVPSSWLTADGCCLWPKANVRSCIINVTSSKDWNKHAMKLCGKYGTYQLALRKERKLSNYSSDSNTN
ncbi:hypothetical protein FQA39_LY14576 [Lamprigera yunnana]|nr:hypothetical protein FQA39_LY14576 [Lamprigera yunnana]